MGVHRRFFMFCRVHFFIFFIINDEYYISRILYGKRWKGFYYDTMCGVSLVNNMLGLHLLALPTEPFYQMYPQLY
jgi:hypothetical protein